MPYEVIVNGDETISVPKDLATVRDVYGNVISVQKKYNPVQKGVVLADEDVSQFVKDQLDAGDERWNSYLKYTDAAAQDAPLTEPLDGYDKASLEDILADLAVRSSDEVAAVKVYEAANEGRSEILDYSVAQKQSPQDRADGKIQADVPESTKKTTSTRGRKSKAQKEQEKLADQPYIQDAGTTVEVVETPEVDVKDRDDVQAKSEADPEAVPAKELNK